MTRIISIVGGMQPSTPTIGTATDGGTGTTVSVAFTPSTYIGKGTITYTATSSPGNLTATGSSSPITVTGLTTGTAYTFTVTGTTNYGVSSAASASSNSVTPASPGAFDSIASATPSGTSTVTFSSIPQTFKHLQLRMMTRDTTNSGSTELTIVRINNNSGNVYYNNYIIASGNNVNATNSYGDGASMWALTFGALSSYSDLFGVSIFDFVDYSSTNKRKTIRANMGLNDTDNGSVNGLRLANWTYLSTDAVSTITLSAVSNFASGTIISLYGIRGS